MRSTPSVSVVLCTYNGARFLPDQLNSILNQTLTPAELIVHDDGSTDDTVALLLSFAAQSPFPVHIHQNASRLGPAQNFAAAMSRATCPLIALADQDDLWLPQKLSILAHHLTAFEDGSGSGNSAPLLAFSNAYMIDEQGRDLGYLLWDSVRFTPSQQALAQTSQFVEVLARQNVVTGATVLFSAELLPHALPISIHWMHDGWIGLIAATLGPVVCVDQPLIKYRQHASQSIGAIKRNLWQQFLYARKMPRNVFEEHARMFEEAAVRLPPDSPHRSTLMEKIAHYQTRSAIRQRQTSRLPAITRELLSGRYSRYSLGWKSLCQDLFL